MNDKLPTYRIEIKNSGKPPDENSYLERLKNLA